MKDTLETVETVEVVETVQPSIEEVLGNEIPEFELPPAALLVCLSQYFKIDSKQLIPHIPNFLQVGSAIYTGSLDPRTREIVLTIRYGAHDSPRTETYKFPKSKFDNIVI